MADMEHDSEQEPEQETPDAPAIHDKRQGAKTAEERPDWMGGVDAEKEDAALTQYLTDHGVDSAGMSLEEKRDHVLRVQAGESVGNTENGDAPEQPQGRHVLTAFMVIVDFDGSAMATDDLMTSLLIERPATFTDFFNGASQVIKDVTNMEQAERTVAALQRHAQEQAALLQVARARQAEIAAKVAPKGASHKRGR